MVVASTRESALASMLSTTLNVSLINNSGLQLLAFRLLFLPNLAEPQGIADD